MRKEEHTIASLEGHAMGYIDRDTVDAAVSASDSYGNTEEAMSLYHSAVNAIELFGLRQELQKIHKEEA